VLAAALNALTVKGFAAKIAVNMMLEKRDDFIVIY
jgi:hypothetical protein